MKSYKTLIILLLISLSFLITILSTPKHTLKTNTQATSCPSLCEMTGDGIFNKDDTDKYAQCIFDKCAPDVNGDGIGDAGDISYCILYCHQTNNAPTSVPPTITSLPEPTQIPQPSPIFIPTQIIQPTIFSQPNTPTQTTESPNTSGNNSSPTNIEPTQTPYIKPTQTTELLRNDTVQIDYASYCDTNKDGLINKDDIDKITKCIFEGYSYCATIDINRDQKADAGDISAATLCKFNKKAQPFCKGADFNNDNTISGDEINKISPCIFSGCSLIDPNQDYKTDAGDISKCILISKSQTPTKKPSFSCNMCNNINFCNKNNIKILEKCIFNSNTSICLKKDKNGFNIWDINQDNNVDAGDISAYTLCTNCKEGCRKIYTASSPLDFLIQYIKTIFLKLIN